jgi:hypothetical protein
MICFNSFLTVMICLLRVIQHNLQNLYKFIIYTQIPFLALLLFQFPLMLHVYDELTIIYSFNNKVHHFYLCNVYKQRIPWPAF